MKAIEVNKDIIDFDSDALVYSTNQHFHLSGGVGACLVNRYGYEVQTLLDKYMCSRGVNEVSVGTIVEGCTNSMPWKKVFHTVATDLDYNTNEEIVRSIIREVLERCEVDYSINSIVFSALGAGYGNLKYESFINVLNELLLDYTEETFIVYVARKT